MRNRIAVLYVALVMAGAAQVNNPLARRMQDVSKRFPPDLPAPTNRWERARFSQPACVTPPDGKTPPSFKPCPPRPVKPPMFRRK